VDGVYIAEMLMDNKTLRKLELEGNLLGPQTARKFGEVLKSNKTLRMLDLESN
jgi:Ran GTPase-activating protein (RanGAP) involved in mRNA processing and transport